MLDLATRPRRAQGFVVELRAGDSIGFSKAAGGGPVDLSQLVVTIEDKSGQRTRVRVVAPHDVVITTQRAAR